MNVSVELRSMIAHRRAADNWAEGSPYLKHQSLQHLRTVRTYLNSLRKARTASLALESLIEARSHTSRTSDQSSEAVAVR